MDTKLKNNNKRGNLLTVIVLLISSVGMMLFYPAFSSYITDQDQKEMRKEEQMLDMLDPILYGNYLLYNEISNETESSEVIEEYGNSRFGLMKKYMKYGIFDESGTAMLTSDESAKKLPEEFDSDTYALCVRFSFDVDGDISVQNRIQHIQHLLFFSHLFLILIRYIGRKRRIKKQHSDR